MPSVCKNNVKESFDLYAKIIPDNRTVISVSDLESVLQAAGQNPTKYQLEKLADQLGLSGINIQVLVLALTQIGFLAKIDWVEYEQVENALALLPLVCSQMDPVSPAHMKAALRQFDHEGVGQISVSDLMQGLTSKGDRLSAEEAQVLIQLFGGHVNCEKLQIDQFVDAVLDA